MPTHRLYSAINRFAAPPAGSIPELGDTYTEELVEGFHPGGLILIRGITTPTRNGLQAQVGDRVTVLWRRGIPFMVIDAQSRKGTADKVPTDFKPIVEQLLVHPTTGEIWFRDYHTFAPVRFVDAEGNEDLSIRPAALDVQTPLWGRGDSDHFLVYSTGNDARVAVYKLSRPKKNTLFPALASVKARLVRFYDLSTDPFEFGTVTLTSVSDGGTSVASGPIRLGEMNYFNGAFGVGDSGIAIRASGGTRRDLLAGAPNGDLLAVVVVVGQSGLGDSSLTGGEYVLGSILVNVTKGTVLVNRLAESLSGSEFAFVVPLPAACQLAGTVTAECSEGIATAEAGQIYPLSYKTPGPNPEDPAAVGTFNNYLLVSPGTVVTGGTLIQDPPGVTVGDLFCGPPRADLTLSIVGEYANADFATFLGNESLLLNQWPQPLLSLSRGLLAWGTLFQNTGVEAGTGKIRDLRRGVTSDLPGTDLGNYAAAAGGAFSPVVLAESMTIYNWVGSPAGPPHNKQFFLAGHDRQTGEITIDLDAQTKLPNLKRHAVLAKATSEGQIACIAGEFGVPISSVQVLVYKPGVGSFYVPPGRSEDASHASLGRRGKQSSRERLDGRDAAAQKVAADSR